jgi:hypothetical protein
MGLRDRIAGLHVTYHDLVDIFADLPFFLYLEATVEQSLFQNVRGDIDIYIII